MSILDSKLSLADAQTIAGNENATTTLENVIDLGTRKSEYGGSTTPNIGEAGELWLNARVATAITPATAAGTLNIYSHTTTSTASGTVIMTKAHTAALGLTAGTTVLRQKLPAGTISEYVGGTFVSGATTITAGALDVWISLDSESELASHPAAYV